MEHMSVSPGDLRLLSRRNGGTFPRKEVTNQIDGRELRSVHGTNEMPVWGWQFFQLELQESQPDLHAQARIEAVVNYLEDLQRSD